MANLTNWARSLQQGPPQPADSFVGVLSAEGDDADVGNLLPPPTPPELSFVFKPGLGVISSVSSCSVLSSAPLPHLLALALLFAACAAQRGGLAPFATLGWGVTAIAFFMLGLFRRIAPYRVLGLVGLALCVPRVFVVDLQSTLHRIAAFIVIGVVMLWVGFSYHRFRHLVTDSSDSSENPSSSK